MSLKGAKKPQNNNSKEETVDKEKHAGGRPTKYKAEYCEQLLQHFDIEPWEEREIPHYKTVEGERVVAWTDYKIMPVRMPTLRGFAKIIGLGISTLYDWINKEHASFVQEFSDAFTYARDIRKEWLIDVGLSGTAPPASFKFVAVNCTDMRDKTETEHSGSIEMKPPEIT